VRRRQDGPMAVSRRMRSRAACGDEPRVATHVLQHVVLCCNVVHCVAT
jgi:hypothetical protein